MAMRPFIRYSFVVILAAVLGACGAVPASEAPTATPAESRGNEGPTQPAQPTVALSTPTQPPQPTVAPQPTAVPAQPTAVPPQPTVAPAEATATPDPGITEPEVVVSAFLTRFSGGGDRSIDPASYLSNNLRAQIRPDYPLNYIMGVQNMYSGFQVVGAEGAAGTVRVRALLSYSEAHEWTFVMISEDGQWRIDQIITPDGPTTPAPTRVPDPQPAAGGTIFYLDPDGVSVNRINADGSGQELAFSGMNHLLGGPITYMGPVPGNQFEIVMVGAGQHYATASGGVSVDLGNFASTPRWSPDGWRVAGASVSANGSPGPIRIFDLRSRESAELSVSGTPDWYPDGQRLLYAACYEADDPGCNVYSYDLASGASARLSQLVSSAEDRWYVQEAHVLPSGNEIVFYGNHTSQVGASGNGLHWWWMPIDGGEAQPFSQNYSNGVNSYLTDPRGGLIAYSTRAHWNACASVGDIVVRDTSVAGDSARGEHPPLPGSDIEIHAFAAVLGMSWDPSGSGRLAFGSQVYTCTDDGRVMQTPGVYIWESGNPAAAPLKLADGSFPVWMP